MENPKKIIREHMDSAKMGIDVSSRDQFKTINKLLEKSVPNTTYYILLVLSSIIITAGLLLNNTAIVIGGMLVTPLLTPILVIALGMSVGEVPLITRTSKFVGYSCLYVIAGGIFMTILFQAPSEFTVIENSVRTALLYFVVAIASGIAATFAWIRREVAEALPGVAIAVSLVPPLALIGIGVGKFDFDFAVFYLVIFLLNMLGILMGSLVVFSLSKFHRMDHTIKQKNEEVVVEQHLQKISKDLNKEA